MKNLPVLCVRVLLSKTLPVVSLRSVFHGKNFFAGYIRSDVVFCIDSKYNIHFALKSNCDYEKYQNKTRILTVLGTFVAYIERIRFSQQYNKF